MKTSKIIKAHCKDTGQYYIIETEKNGAVYFANKFYPISLERAKEIESEISPIALQTGPSIPSCSICGSRKVAHGNADNHICNCKSNPDNIQNIYCGSLSFDAIGEKSISVYKPEPQVFDIYLVMDSSGSMSASDLNKAAEATRTLVKQLSVSKNNYYFVPFGTDYKYLLSAETDLNKIEAAITKYERGNSGVGYSTNGRVLEFIKNDVISSKNPVRVIIVTDGEWGYESAAIYARNEMINGNDNVEILAIGIGYANNKFLNQIGTVKQFSKVVDVGNLEQTFLDISKMIMFK